MAVIGKPDRGTVEMNSEECKGCGLCVEACPPRVLHLADGLNRYGYHPANYGGGVHWLRHLLLRLSRTGRNTGIPAGGRLGECHAKTTDQRQRGDREGRGAGGLPGLLRVPDHAGERDRRSGRALPAARRRRFVQAESEVAAINMLYGGASAGVRCMTASSGPGISLMQEGFSYLAGAELPCVIADIMRGGPGLGNIAPEQSDYNQIVKGGGHGCYRTLVVAPDSVQEMADLTTRAFDLADHYRNPAVVLADGFIGQMMEPVEFARRPPAGAAGMGRARHRGDARNLVSSIYLEPDDLERHIRKLEEKYQAGGTRGRALRNLAHGRRGDRAGGLRNRGPHPEGRGRTGAGARHGGRSAAADHAVPVPGAAAPRPGADTPRPSPWWN